MSKTRYYLEKYARWIIPMMWAYLVYNELFIINNEHSLVLGNIAFANMIAAILWAAEKIPNYVFVATASVTVLSATSFYLSWSSPVFSWGAGFVASVYGFWLTWQAYKRDTAMEESK